NSCQMH
ncbi:sulfate transporter family protein, partial [Chlamydia psittaci 02DC14]